MGSRKMLKTKLPPWGFEPRPQLAAWINSFVQEDYYLLSVGIVIEYMSFDHCSFKMWSSHNIYKKNYYCTVLVVEYGKALDQISPQNNMESINRAAQKNWGINIWATQPILVIFTRNITYNRLRSWNQFLWSFKSFSNCLY